MMKYLIKYLTVLAVLTVLVVFVLSSLLPGADWTVVSPRTSALVDPVLEANGVRRIRVIFTDDSVPPNIMEKDFRVSGSDDDADQQLARLVGRYQEALNGRDSQQDKAGENLNPIRPTAPRSLPASFEQAVRSKCALLALQAFLGASPTDNIGTSTVTFAAKLKTLDAQIVGALSDQQLIDEALETFTPCVNIGP